MFAMINVEVHVPSPTIEISGCTLLKVLVSRMILYISGFRTLLRVVQLISKTLPQRLLPP